MDLREFRVVVRIVDRVAKRALFAEEQMVALEGQCAEWKRIADELKAERNAAKQEAVSARQDAVTRAEADRKRIDGLMIQAQDMRAEIERLKKPRQHPVKVGEYVKNDNGDVCQVPTASHDTPEGKAVAESASEDIRVGDMVEVFQKTSSDTLFDDVSIHGTVSEVFWAETGNKCVRLDSSTMNRRSRGGSYFAYCDVRKRQPKQQPGQSRVMWCGWCGFRQCECITRVVRAVFGLEWPLSCVEVVKGGKS